MPPLLSDFAADFLTDPHDALADLVAQWHWIAALLVMMISMIVLGKGADWLVEDAVILSLRWGLPRVVVGATIVSLGTTTPEAVVSVMAAIQGSPDMALGNAVGSIICDTGLILGIACLIAPLPIDPRIANRQGWVQFSAGFLLVGLCIPWTGLPDVFKTGGNLSQLGGFLMVGLLAVYMAWSIRIARSAPAEEESGEGDQGGSMARVLARLTLGIVLVVVSSAILIATAEALAERLHVPRAIIAATLVAFGTSLPELIIVVTATLKGHGSLAIGNIIGADILNVLFVAGLAAAVTGGDTANPAGGLHAQPEFFWMQFPAMLLVLTVFRIGIGAARDGKLQKRFGFILLGTYLLVTIVSYLLSSDPTAAAQ